MTDHDGHTISLGDPLDAIAQRIDRKAENITDRRWLVTEVRRRRDDATKWRLYAETLAAADTPLTPDEFKARYIDAAPVPVSGGEPDTDTSTCRCGHSDRMHTMGDCWVRNCDCPVFIRSAGDSDSSGKRCPTCANAGWVGSRSNPDDCPTCDRKPYWTVGDGTYPSPLPVPSAGGDQPDTPCRLCDDTGQYPPPGAGASTFPRPCPACTDKETPHAR
jgi:hypothetical protein